MKRQEHEFYQRCISNPAMPQEVREIAEKEIFKEANETALTHLRTLVKTAQRFELDKFTVTTETAAMVLALAEFGFNEIYETKK